MDKIARSTLKDGTQPVKDVIKLSDVKSFNLSYWICSLNISIYYLAIFPFIALGK
jgi:hypothetical protein